MEGELLSRRFIDGEDAAVLRRAILHDRNQLHISPHSRAEDDRQLESADTREIPVCAQSAAKNHPLVDAEGLRRHIGIFLQSRDRVGGATWAGAVSTSANVQKRRRRAQFISS